MGYPTYDDDARDMARHLAALSTWIDQHPANAMSHPETLLWSRIGKIAEENGEVVAALISHTGQNPRKVERAPREAITKELLDVAVTALAAVEHMTGNQGSSMLLLKQHLEGLQDRIPKPDPLKDAVRRGMGNI